MITVADLTPESAGDRVMITFTDGDIRVGTLRRAIRKGTPPGRVHLRRAATYGRSFSSGIASNGGYPDEIHWALEIPSRLPFETTDYLDLTYAWHATVTFIPDADGVDHPEEQP